MSDQARTRTEEEKQWIADIEAAARYKQSVSGNPPYCSWPTYSETEELA